MKVTVALPLINDSTLFTKSELCNPFIITDAKSAQHIHSGKVPDYTAYIGHHTVKWASEMGSTIISTIDEKPTLANETMAKLLSSFVNTKDITNFPQVIRTPRVGMRQQVALCAASELCCEAIIVVYPYVAIQPGFRPSVMVNTCVVSHEYISPNAFLAEKLWLAHNTERLVTSVGTTEEIALLDDMVRGLYSRILTMAIIDRDDFLAWERLATPDQMFRHYLETRVVGSASHYSNGAVTVL